MSTFTGLSRAPWYFRIPLFGWVARDLVHGGRENILYFLVILVTLLVMAVKTWGLVALGLTALATVPVIFATSDPHHPREVTPATACRLDGARRPR